MLNDSWTLRAGYNHTQNPIRSSDVTFNIIAPGVVQNQWSMGTTYRIDRQSEVTGSFMFAQQNDGDRPEPVHRLRRAADDDGNHRHEAVPGGTRVLAQVLTESAPQTGEHGKQPRGGRNRSRRVFLGRSALHVVVPCVKSTKEKAHAQESR